MMYLIYIILIALVWLGIVYFFVTKPTSNKTVKTPEKKGRKEKKTEKTISERIVIKHSGKVEEEDIEQVVVLLDDIKKGNFKVLTPQKDNAVEILFDELVNDNIYELKWK